MRLVPVLLLPVLSLAQTPVFSNIKVQAKTWSSAVVMFSVNVPTIENVIEYGPAAGNYTHSNVRRLASNTDALTISASVTGLDAATTYHYRVCGSYKGVRACSPDRTLTTDPPPADPWHVDPPEIVPPTDIDMSGAVNLPVAADCSNFLAQLTKATQDTGPTKYRIAMPPGAGCAGRFNLYPRPATAGHILIEPDNSVMLHPPPGVRRDPRKWKTSDMGRLLLNTTTAGAALLYLHAKGTNNLILRNIEFGTERPEGSGNNLSKNVTAVKAGNPAVFTVPGHGYTATASGDPVKIHLYGCTGESLQGERVGTIGGIAADTFTIEGVSSSSDDVAGCKVIRDPTYMSYFVYAYGNTPSGGLIVDRCYMHNEFPFQIATAVLWGGLGSMAVVDSWIETSAWKTRMPDGTQPAYQGGSVIALAVGMTYGKGVLLRNNMIRTPGISIFAQEGYAGSPPVSDVSVLQNDFDWDPKHKMNDPASDGKLYVVRQPLEWKRGKRILIEGNRLGRTWSTGVTGANVGVIVLTPRVVWGDLNTKNEITDVTIQRNEVTAGVGFIQSTGGNTEEYPLTTPVTRRIRVVQNLVYGIDGVAWMADGARAQGHVMSFSGGYEAVSVTHNTFWDFFMRYPDSSIFPIEGNRGNGLRIIGNTIGMNTSRPSTWSGTVMMKPPPKSTTVFAEVMRDKFKNAVIANNAWVPGVAGAQATSDFNLPGITNCASILAGSDPSNVCLEGENANARMAAVEYVNHRERQFTLKPTSRFISGKSGRAADGGDLGVILEAVWQASGRPLFVRLLNIKSDSAELYFQGPAGCYVDRSTEQDFRSVTRLALPGSGRQSVKLEALTGNTGYYWRLMCKSEPVSGNFKTL